MPSRSKIEKLPPEILEQLEQRIIKQNYDDYELISDWLQDQGYDVTTDNVYRHGRKLKQQAPAIMKIRAELENVGITPSCTNDELQRLLIQLGTLRLQERFIMAQIVDLSKFS